MLKKMLCTVLFFISNFPYYQFSMISLSGRTGGNKNRSHPVAIYQKTDTITPKCHGTRNPNRTFNYVQAAYAHPI
jgi:hypothetical protein